MATQPIREPRAPLGSVLMRPIEWAHGQSLRLLEWFNQERWTITLALLALGMAKGRQLVWMVLGVPVNSEGTLHFMGRAE
jgi:hypothetical protein